MYANDFSTKMFPVNALAKIPTGADATLNAIMLLFKFFYFCEIFLKAVSIPD
jgi:hypothetical protein